MRSTFLLAAIVCVAFALAVSAADDAPPSTNKAGDDKMCLLNNLALNNGVTILGDFKSTVFNYQCSCLDWTNVKSFGEGSPQLDILTVDFGSNAQVWFNGVAVHTRAKGNALTNVGQHLSNPLASSAANKWKDGSNLIQVLVGCNVLNEDGSHVCEYEYQIKCVKPPTNGGFVTGDPQFVGLRGQNYQVHGVAGEVYNVVSDADLQYNSRFVFLHSGACPVVNGQKQHGCFSHPGSYLGELGLKTSAGDRVHLVTGSAKVGFTSVTVNDKEVAEGETVMLAGELGSVSRNTTHLASVLIGNWDFAFENSDKFVNQRVRVLDARSLRSHGLLGQTWRETTYPNSIKYVQGHVDDYVIRDGDIFGDDFLYNAHN